jgi:hypothetical protein
VFWSHKTQHISRPISGLPPFYDAEITIPPPILYQGARSRDPAQLGNKSLGEVTGVCVVSALRLVLAQCRCPSVGGAVLPRSRRGRRAARCPPRWKRGGPCTLNLTSPMSRVRAWPSPRPETCRQAGSRSPVAEVIPCGSISTSVPPHGHTPCMMSTSCRSPVWCGGAWWRRLWPGL